MRQDLLGSIANFEKQIIFEAKLNVFLVAPTAVFCPRR
jgi:hypothetical protein